MRMRGHHWSQKYGGLSWRANTEGFRKGEHEDKNDCHKTTRDSWEEINAEKRQRSAAEKRLWIETQNKFVDILFALNSCVFYLFI